MYVSIHLSIYLSIYMTGEVRQHSGSRKMLSSEAAHREKDFTPKVRPEPLNP